jgi:hypothetical protein
MNERCEPDERTIAIRVTEGLCNLRRNAPKEPVLRFTGPREGWPPKPCDQKDVKPVSFTKIPDSLSDEEMDKIIEAVLGDERVRLLLGEKYAYISNDVLSFRKAGSRENSGKPRIKVLFFSYTNQIAVEITTLGANIESAFTLRGYQPPEGPGEVQQAIQIARNDERLRDKVRNLDGHGILLTLSEEQGKEKGRLIWVIFTDLPSTDEELPALCAAIVDIIEQKVIVVRTDIYDREEDTCHAKHA